MANVQPDRIGAGFRTSEKIHCSTPSLRIDLQQPLGNLPASTGLFGWRRSGSECHMHAMMRDERIRTLRDAWQHAIGNVIAAAACLPTG